MQVTFEPIGFLQSCYIDKFGTPRQPGLVPEASARLKIRKNLQPEEALQGLEGFSHVWVTWVFHKNSNTRYHAKVHPPRGGGRSMGVFATRSPHRPNPLGLSLVRLLAIEGDTVVLGGIDLMDGTPVLDIKPYLPSVEALPDARVGWVNEATESELEVRFSEEAEALLSAWTKRSSRPELRDLIMRTIQLDPRPLVYRQSPETSPYRTEHAFRLFDGDIHFKFVDESQVEVFKILF